jgi:hypothetical protein
MSKSRQDSIAAGLSETRILTVKYMSEGVSMTEANARNVQ